MSAKSQYKQDSSVCEAYDPCGNPCTRSTHRDPDLICPHSRGVTYLTAASDDGCNPHELRVYSTVHHRRWHQPTRPFTYALFLQDAETEPLKALSSYERRRQVVGCVHG
ncbi:hypothetical protein LSAT2_001535 [Lamellibrachia satsuma]|nr:hypothetical protein LSAT2_001535 [Lamellibrachia satsuma]